MPSKIKGDEEVIFFRSAGWFDDVTRSWQLPIHGWIFEPEVGSGWRKYAIRKVQEKAGQKVHISNEDIFRRRARMFLVEAGCFPSRRKTGPAFRKGSGRRLRK